MNTKKQLVRFFIVGLVSNAFLFMLYLGLTSLGVRHLIAMSALYAVGVMQTFIANKRWSFRHSGDYRGTMVRYLLAYGSCYLLNLIILYALVNRVGLSHQVVQGSAVVGIALLMFILQKYWIFYRLPEGDQHETLPIVQHTFRD